MDGKTTIGMIYLAFGLSQNRNRKALHATYSEEFKWILNKKYWNTYPHLIIDVVDWGIELQFPRCDL